MLNTNSEFIRAEIMDVIRLYDAEDEEFTHYFSYGANEYYNCIEYGGEFYDFTDKQQTENEVEFKRYAKRFVKLAFYAVLSKTKGIKFPYGALTGVRPTKLAYMEAAAGRDFKELFKTCGVSEENIAHVGRILEVQKPYYESRGGQDLFVSIPFCPTKCEYCSFITAPIAKTEKYVDNYVSCVEKELASVKPLLTDIKSIYIGGGTPFAIDINQLGRIYAAINALNLKNCEYTVEAGRPDTFTEEKLKLTKDFGVTRICINPQSFSDKTLEKIGRKHTCADIYRAFEMSAKYDFDINIDLIAGLADESLADFENSLKKAIELNPANITVHTLSLKAGARLKENCTRLVIDDIGAMLALSRKMLTAAGYEPYYMYRQKYQAGGHENCGWAKRGKACVYNIDVMEEIADNIAVGANAISKRIFGDSESIARCASPKDIPTYIQKVDKIIEERNGLFKGAQV
ncbi:MAG: coproporphyrinogen dehydrogenase HemZ [Clostridia bacterium]|nr:coproporphyrinogen dehydrogenase HemZ [Clostridia bacterium]